MEILEVILLIIAYTVIILTLFVEIICYKRNLETIEVIHLTGSLLLLIVAITLNYFFYPTSYADPSSIFLLECMTLVALTTPLNVFAERNYRVKSVSKKLLVMLTGLIMAFIPISYFLKIFTISEYLTAIFLSLSVVFSMLIIKTTKPKVLIASREKIDRYLATAFMIFIPLSFVANYVADSSKVNIRIGFTIPLIFILMAGSKLWDDIQRLSLFATHKGTIQEQNLENYAFTKREKEVVALLVSGKTYKQIAEQLFISIPTVKSHAYNIYKKCNINNRFELISLLS